MKSQLIAIVAAVLVVGCGESQQSVPAPEAKPVEPVAEATKPEPPTQTSATIYSDKCRFLVEVPNMDQVWEWGVTGANTCEYRWMVRIKAGDKVYELGYSFFNPNSRKQKGRFKELLKVGQTNMWLLDGGGASYVEGVYVNANTEGEFLVLELDDKAWTERLFKERPETVSIQIGGSELNKSESEVRVQYFAEEATADLIRKHGEAQRIRCVNNLKEIRLATLMYASDNQDRYPWQVPQSEGGTAEIAQPRSDTDGLLDNDGKPIFDANAWQHFLALSPYLPNPKVFRCPSDGSRTQANTFQSTPPKGAGRNVIPFDKNSVSYWLRTDPEVGEARRNEVMVVCPHHDGQYNILLTDSSVQQASWNRLAQYFKDITNPITIAPQ